MSLISRSPRGYIWTIGQNLYKKILVGLHRPAVVPFERLGLKPSTIVSSRFGVVKSLGYYS